MNRVVAVSCVIILAALMGACGSAAAPLVVSGSPAAPSATVSLPPSSSPSAPSMAAASPSDGVMPATESPAAASPTDPGSPAAFHAGYPVAGTYTTTTFQPRLTVSIDDGWWVLFDPDADGLALEGDSGDGDLFVAFRVKQVVNPKNGAAMDAPDDLIAWLRSHPSLVADPPTGTTVDGRPATSIEATTGSRPAVDLIAFPAGNFHLPPHVRLRFTVVPMAGPDLMVATGGNTDRFESAIARTDQMLASMQIGDTSP